MARSKLRTLCSLAGVASCLVLLAILASGVAAAADPVPAASAKSGEEDDPFGDKNPHAPLAGALPSLSSPASASAVHTAEPDYSDLLTYRWKQFVFRPALFWREGLLLVGLVIYLIASFLGSTYNKRLAKAWFDAHFGLFSRQFAHVGGVGDGGKDDFIIRSSAQESVGFATGRRGVKNVLIKVDLLPRQDIWTLLYGFLRPLADVSVGEALDTVTLTFELPSSRIVQATPSSGADDFVFAVVNKNAMKALRQSRWDLKTYASTADSPALPVSYAIMSENGDVTDWFLKGSKAGIVEVLKGPNAEFFDYLSVSGEWTEVPDESALLSGPPPKVRKLTLGLRVPPSSRAGETQSLVELALNVADALQKGPPVPLELAAKFKRRRTEVIEKLLAESKAEAKEEAEKARLKKKKEFEEERISKMSKAEQQKHAEKEKKKELKKAQGKMVKRR